MEQGDTGTLVGGTQTRSKRTCRRRTWTTLCPNLQICPSLLLAVCPVLSYRQSRPLGSWLAILASFRLASRQHVWTWGMTRLQSSGHVWTHLEMSGHIWTHLEMSGHIWTHLDTSGHFWTLLDSSGHVNMWNTWTREYVCTRAWGDGRGTWSLVNG